MFTYTCDACGRSHEMGVRAEDVQPQLYLVTKLSKTKTCENCFENVEDKWIDETT